MDFKKDTWFYALIAAILAIIGILVPAGGVDPGAGEITWLWFGDIIAYNADAPTEWFSLAAAGGNTAGLWTLVLAAMSAAIFLWYGLHGMKGMEFKWDWLVYLLLGIVCVIFPILYWVYAEEPPVGDAVFGPAPLLILFAGIVAIVAFVLDKFMGE
ncbi:MAG: hypothetical protein ACFE9T_00510 [Promethearchaeota archaeon]